MLELKYCNDGVFVFDVNAWIFLRREHRILGEFVGNTNFIPTLPAKLLPEEALYLHEINVAKIITCSNQNLEQDLKLYEDFENKLLEEQQVIYKEVRKTQLEGIIDKIIEAKRKRGDERSREEIFNEELEKSCKVTKENMIWPIFHEPLNKGSQLDINLDIILKQTTKLRFLVYKDLHERGYFITSGHKFGGDFLVYLGDPVSFHAIFIIHCIENADEIISPTEIVAFGRLGTSVRKRAVLASLDDNEKVSYITINWIDAE